MPASKRKKVRSVSVSVSGNILPLLIILVSIICVFSISRWIAYLVLVGGQLPPWLFAQIGEFRLHHFVYGNILITVTSFLAIGLGIGKHKNLFAVFYGLGLGLVLDEFLLWMGDVRQLTSNTLFIPYSFSAIAIVTIVIASIIMVDLYKIRLNGKKKTQRQI